MKLERGIESHLEKKKILLMTHQVLGYPDFETNEKAIDCFYRNGVDLVELQIPYSDPMADGPLFVKSNQKALDEGVTVEACLKFIEKMVQRYPSLSILIMTYYNIVYQFGVEAMLERAALMGVQGIIVPDAPIDEAKDFYAAAKANGIGAVAIATPYTDAARLQTIASVGSGFIYYVPRKGVTGTKTLLDESVLTGIRRAKELSGKRIAVGFGIQSDEDIAKLLGVSDIAIIGSKIQDVIEREGLEGLEVFMSGLKRMTQA